jgi:UDP-N-acetylmuramate dehydrogenase
VLSLRKRKGMVLDEADHDTWSVGSFFTNPVVTAAVFDGIQGRSDALVPNYPAPNGIKLAAGWLVEHAGFQKGYPADDAPARLSTKHALALTNRGNAKASDVIALARRVRDGVKADFGIELTPEPILVGGSL